MDYGTVNAVLAILAVVAAVGSLVLVVAAIAARFSSDFARRWSALRLRFSAHAVALAWLTGLVCTSGSLYLQFGEHLIPCDLCWFQRICMYPQAVLLGVATAMGDRYFVKRYALPLTAIGGVISVVHIELANIMSLFRLSSFPGCSLTAPCTLQPISEWGFLTIPMMALAGFVFITCLLLSAREDEDAEGSAA